MINRVVDFINVLYGDDNPFHELRRLADLSADSINRAIAQYWKDVDSKNPPTLEQILEMSRKPVDEDIRAAVKQLKDLCQSQG